MQSAETRELIPCGTVSVGRLDHSANAGLAAVDAPAKFRVMTCLAEVSLVRAIAAAIQYNLKSESELYKAEIEGTTRCLPANHPDPTEGQA